MYREWLPPVEWADTVACLWEQHVEVPTVQRVVPDGCADVLFDGDAATVVGLHDEVDLPELAAGTRIRGVRLRPEAVRTVLGVPGDELRNQTVPWDGPLDLTGAPPARVGAALRALTRSSVDDAAAEVELSGRQLRRLLHEEVGVGPKAFQRVARLQRFLRSTAPLVEAATEAGYADQAHLTREVTRMCGLSPAALRAERGAG